MNQPPARKMAPPPPSQSSRNVIKFEQIQDSKRGDRTLLYGVGGIGKSELACMAPGPVAFIDADESLEKLKPQLKDHGIPIPVRIPCSDWATTRAALQSDGYDKIKTVVLDTWAPAEAWLVADTLQNVKKDGGARANFIEEYGFGKGYRFTFDRFLTLLGDLDRHARAGRNVIIIAHDTTFTVPNPSGQDFLRWEPKMQHTKEASIRDRTKQWADHVLFYSYDIGVDKVAGDNDGRKAGRVKGAQTRTLYCVKQAHFEAKSRTCDKEFDVTLETMMQGISPWTDIFK